MGVSRDVRVAFRSSAGDAAGTWSDDLPTLVRPASFVEEEPTLKYRKPPRPADSPAPRPPPSLQATMSDAEITRDLRFGSHANVPALVEATAAELERVRRRRRLTRVLVLAAGLAFGGAAAAASSCWRGAANSRRPAVARSDDS